MAVVKRSLLVFFIISLAAPAALAQRGQQTYPNGRFSLWTPKSWTVDTEDAIDGRLKFTIKDQSSASYRVSWRDGERDLDNIFKKLKAVAKQRGWAVRQKDILYVGSQTARRMVIDVKQSDKISRQMLTWMNAGGRFYMLHGSFPKDDYSRALLTKVLQSFKSK